MAGYREFQTGEILTAANVDDFLAKQAVMKFADSAARDSALGTAVAGGNALREGMVAYLDDENEVQYFDGTAWDAISQPPAGIGSNVVQAVKTDVFTVAATTFTDVTGLSVTITPSSATSKILLIAYVNFAGTSSNGGGVLLTGGNSSTFLGDADGVRVRAAAWKTIFSNSQEDMGSAGITYLDSPATASPVTYTVQVRAGNGGSVTVNRSNADSNTAQFGRTASSLTAIEVAA